MPLLLQLHYNFSGIKSIRLLFCVLILFTVTNSCKQNKNTPGNTGSDSLLILKAKSLSAIKNAALLIKDGDLITRSDNDFESLSLQNFSKRDKTYSHSGITFREDGVLYVYHCMAGVENPGATIKREPFDSFVNPARKTGFGIFRYQLSSGELNSFHDLYKNYLIKKLPFDKSFNLQNDDSMYCSEVIYKSLKRATNNRIILPISVITNFKPKGGGKRSKDIFFKKFEYVGLDDLYMNSFCTEISRIYFK